MKKLLKQISFVFIVQVFIALTNLLLLYFISSFYGVDSYGNYYLIKRVANIISLILLIGLTVSIPRYFAFYQKEGQTNIIRIIVILLPLIGAFFLILTSEFILPVVLGELFQQYNIIVLFLALSLVIFLVINSYQRAIENFKGFNIYTLFNYAIIPMGIFFLTDTLYNYLFSYSITMLSFNLIIYFIFVFKFIYDGIFQDGKIYSLNLYIPVLKFAVFRFPGLVMASIIFTLPIIVLNNYGMNYEMGILSQLFQLFPILVMPINAVGTVLLPKLSGLIADQKIGKISDRIHKYSLRFLVVSILICTVIYFFSDVYFNFLNEESVRSNFSYVSLLVFSLSPFSFYTLFRNPIDAASEKSYSTLLVLSSFTIAVIFFSILFFFSTLSLALNVVISMSILFFSLGILSYYYITILYRRESK